MKKSVDARKLPCPKPVIITRQAINEGGFTALEILVDNIAAKENVLRMLSSCGYPDAGFEETDYGYLIQVGEKQEALQETAEASSAKTIFFASRYLGSGDDRLGELLMRGFIYSLTELETPPQELIFMNSSVYLSLQDSASLQDLIKLQDRGTKIQVCGTCLDFYKVTEQLGVGVISNMYSITESLMAGDVIKIS